MDDAVSHQNRPASEEASARSVSAVLDARGATRAFLERPVARDELEAILRNAARAPSNGNLQPWHARIVDGAEMAAFKAFMHRHCRENPDGETMPHPFYPALLSDTQLARKQGNGARLYAALGIDREDADARREWIFENFEFFGAPSGVLLFLDANATPYQWLDIGIYLQSTLLLLQEAGLDSCPQADWAMYAEAVKTFLGITSLTLVCGIAVGHADSSRPINGVRTDRDDPLALLNPSNET